jgi:integrative and conjugative element protein (TIGR02256 family)
VIRQLAMLGRYIVDSRSIVIDEATEPAPLDVRRPRFWQRIDPAHVDRAMAAWDGASGRMHYVGEWHTHSEPVPNPSALDREAWLDAYANCRKMEEGTYAPLVFAIVGQQAIGFWEVGP